MEPTELQKKSLAYSDYRCSCGKLFFKGVLFSGGIEIKCPRCGQLRSFFGSGKKSIPGRYAFLTNREGRIVNASDSVRENLQYDPAVLAGRNTNEICGDLASRLTNKALISGITPDFRYFRAEISHRAQDGSHVPVRVSYKYLENNQGGFVIQIIDKAIPAVCPENSPEAEKSFCRHKQTDFMAELDNEGRIIYVGSEIEAILGFRPEEAIGKSVLDFCSPEEAAWRGENLRRVISTKISGHFSDQRLIHKDGRPVDYEACITPLYDDSGEAFGIRVVCWMKK